MATALRQQRSPRGADWNVYISLSAWPALRLQDVVQKNLFILHAVRVIPAGAQGKAHSIVDRLRISFHISFLHVGCLGCLDCT